jgi:DUF2075 family protein
MTLNWLEAMGNTMCKTLEDETYDVYRNVGTNSELDSPEKTTEQRWRGISSRLTNCGAMDLCEGLDAESSSQVDLKTFKRNL